MPFLPRDLEEKPTPEIVRELYDWNQRYWSLQVALDTILKSLILEQHVVLHADTNNPERTNRLEPERVTLGEGPRTIDVVSALYASPPVIGLTWTGKGTRSVAKTDDLEIALNELMDQLNPPGDSPRWRQRLQMIALGREAALFLPGHSYWWDVPRKNEAETDEDWLKRYEEWQHKAPIPILWRDLPVESTFPPSFGSVNDLALSTIQTTWYELKDIFSAGELGDALPQEQEKRFEPVTLGIYANRHWIAYTLLAGEKSGVYGRRSYEDKLLRVIEHKLKTCPIRIMPGRTSAWREPGQFWKSILHDVRAQIPQLDRRASEASTASRISVMPWLKAWLNKGGDENSAGGARIRKMFQGDVVDLDIGDASGEGREDIQAIFIPPFGRENVELMNMQRDTIRDMTGAYEALTGQVIAASMPAWSLNQITEHAKSRHKELTTAVVAAELDHAEMLLRCVEAFGERIVLYRHDEKGGSITLEPDDLTDWVPVLKAEYRLSTPTNEIAMIQTAVQMMQAIDQQNLPLDMFWVMEKFLNIEQPYKMFKDAEVTRFLRSPKMAAWREKLLLEEAEVELAEDEFVTAQEFEQRYAGKLPPQMEQFARQRLGNEAVGAGIAQSPYSRSPGGPQPENVAT
ncbi:MAG: hypothetical protein A2W00_13325 [Candidatus Eisenbacteria bacterium RBG_16_71_46]|nr:MAG: hypothetical protein A2W00_13325 [Candidatus Eisenbacteria bacterium RBG_16_71_46]